VLLSRPLPHSPDLLLSRLDRDKLPILRSAFIPLGLNRLEFVKKIEPALDLPKEDRLSVIVGLLALFDAVDIDGDGTLEWDEFASFIASPPLPPASTPQELLAQAVARIPRRYVGYPGKSLQTHPSNVLDIVALSNSNIGILEDNSSSIYEYNPVLRLTSSYPLPSLPSDHPHASILSLSHDPHSSVLAFVATNKTMYFYDTSYRKELLYKQFLPTAVYSIFFIPSQGAFATVSENHSITLWKFDIKKLSEVPLSVGLLLMTGNNDVQGALSTDHFLFGTRYNRYSCDVLSRRLHQIVEQYWVSFVVAASRSRSQGHLS